MKVKITYYAPVEKEIEMTPAEYCTFHADGKFHNEVVIPEKAIFEKISLDKESTEELDKFLIKTH